MSRPHTCRFLKMWSVVTFLETTSHDGILLKTLQASSIMPHLAYISMRLTSWTFDSNPLWMICSWPCMPSSSAPILAHAFSTTIEAIGLGKKLSYCSLGNRSNTSCSCPHFTSPMITFQETTSCEGILLSTLKASSMRPHWAYMSMRLHPTKPSDSQSLWMIC